MAAQRILRIMSVRTTFKKLTVSQVIKISESSLPCSQKPTNGSYSELHEHIYTFQYLFFKINFNIIRSSTHKYFKRSLHGPFCARYLTFPSHSPSFDHLNNISLRVQMTKLHIIQFSPFSWLISSLILIYSSIFTSQSSKLIFLP
jgi:hypothetical protein